MEEHGRVFISHSSEDRDLADAYHDALEAAEIPCWVAHRDIPAGGWYPEAIIKAITECSAFIVIFSEHSNASDHVATEIERAFNARKPILVARTDAADPATNARLSYFLSSHHWFDAEGLRPEQYLPRLVASVQAILEGAAAASSDPTAAADAAAADAFAAAAQLERAGRWDDADQRYRKLLASSSERVRCTARIRLARCLLETCNRGETDEAAELLAQAESMPALQRDEILRGELALQKGRLDDLNARVKHALERYDDARRLLAAGGADLAEVDLVLASAERRRGEFNKSLERLSAMDEASLPPWLLAEYYDELGATLLARGQAREAFMELEKGLALDAATGSDYTSGRTKLLLAQARMRLGAVDEAFVLIEEALAAYRREESMAGQSEAYAAMGSWYEEREDYAGAIHSYLDSYECDRTSNDRPGMIRAKRLLAGAYRRRGQSARAHELLADARELLSADDDVERAAILREEGHLAISGSSPDYDEAIRLFEAALRIAEEDGDERTIALAKRDLAAAHRADEKFERAETLLLEARDALEARGDYRELADLLDDLGELKLEWDKYEEAQTHLLESLRYDNDLGRVASKARSLLLLGRVASRSVDQDLAGERFSEARELYDKARNDVGLSDALKALSAWQLTQGQVDDAVDGLHRALSIDQRLDRRLGRVHAKRLLAAAARERGRFGRAAEYLSQAREDLEGVKDEVEEATLDLEEGRLELALGDHAAARGLLEGARTVFAQSDSPVDAASCQRFIALTLASQGRYTDALAELEAARAVFQEHCDFVELDDLYDDLGTVHLMRGDLTAAYDAVSQSLALGRTGSWRRGKGRSLLLLAKIAIASGDRAGGRRHLDDALKLFKRIGDTLGEAATLIELADMQVADARLGSESADERAVTLYKDARALLRHHRNRRGVARCNRKLALVYLSRGELQRADEALSDAEGELVDIDDPRDLAPLELAFGRLAAAFGNHSTAIDHLLRALDGFTILGQAERRAETQHLLVHNYHAEGDVKAALECVRQMEVERISMYSVLVDELDDGVVRAAGPTFAAGGYATAVDLAFAAVEQDLRRRAAARGVPAGRGEDVSAQIAAWGEAAAASATALDPEAIRAFARFCAGMFDVARSAMWRGANETPTEAFGAITMASWITRSLSVLDGDAVGDPSMQAELSPALLR